MASDNDDYDADDDCQIMHLCRSKLLLQANEELRRAVEDLKDQKRRVENRLEDQRKVHSFVWTNAENSDIVAVRLSLVSHYCAITDDCDRKLTSLKR